VANIKLAIEEFTEDIQEMNVLIGDLSKNNAKAVEDILKLEERTTQAESQLNINTRNILTHDTQIATHDTRLNELEEELSFKQGNLVPGENIEFTYDIMTEETIISSTAKSDWGEISGNIQDQTDLMSLFNSKIGILEDEEWGNTTEFSYQVQIDELQRQISILQKQLNGLSFKAIEKEEYDKLLSYEDNTIYVTKE
jgi:chromosome segregation ATPase